MPDANPYAPPPPGADDAAEETPRQLPPDQMYYIGFWRRLGARAIDSMVLLAPTLALLFLFKQTFADPVLRQTVLGLVGLVLGAVYFIVVQGRRGQTLGKLATRIQVRLTDGSAFTYAAAVWRHSPEVVLTVLMLVLTHHGIGVVSLGDEPEVQENLSQWIIWAWYLAEVIVLATNAKKRAIHDFVAGTVVVRTPARRPAVVTYAAYAAPAATGAAPSAAQPDAAANPNAADDDDDDDDPLAERVLCPDGACIGVIGQDGLCKVCGKPAHWQP